MAARIIHEQKSQQPEATSPDSNNNTLHPTTYTSPFVGPEKSCSWYNPLTPSKTEWSELTETFLYNWNIPSSELLQQPPELDAVTLKMEAECPSETSGETFTTRYPNPKYNHYLNMSCYRKMKTCVYKRIFLCCVYAFLQVLL